MGSDSGVKERRKEGLWSMDAMEWDVYLCTIYQMEYHKRDCFV